MYMVMYEQKVLQTIFPVYIVEVNMADYNSRVILTSNHFYCIIWEVTNTISETLSVRVLDMI